MRYILVAIASVVSLVIVGAAFLFYPNPESKAEPAPKPVAARYWSTPRLMSELAPRQSRFAGAGLGLPGATCHVYVMTSFPRVVIVCA